jgi:hypothetical protein
LPARLNHSGGGTNDKSRPDDQSDGHLHTTGSFKDGKDPGHVWRNIKSFTAMKIIDAIIKNPKESRKEHLLQTFIDKGKKSSSNCKYQFWLLENHPVLLDTKKCTTKSWNIYLSD